MEFRGTPILTLEEALLIVRDMKLINIEIKKLPNSLSRNRGKSLPPGTKAGFNPEVVLSSFHHRVALESRQYLPEVSVGLLYDKPIFNPARYAGRQGAQAIHPHNALVSKNQIRIAKELGYKKRWTVDKPRRALTLQDWGCDGVITNTPDVILKALGR